MKNKKTKKHNNNLETNIKSRQERLIKISETICFINAILLSVAIAFYLIFINEPLGDYITHYGIKGICIIVPMLFFLITRFVAKYVIIIIMYFKSLSK